MEIKPSLILQSVWFPRITARYGFNWTDVELNPTRTGVTVCGLLRVSFVRDLFDPPLGGTANEGHGNRSIFDLPVTSRLHATGLPDRNLNPVQKINRQVHPGNHSSRNECQLSNFSARPTSNFSFHYLSFR